MSRHKRHNRLSHACTGSPGRLHRLGHAIQYVPLSETSPQFDRFVGAGVGQMWGGDACVARS